MPAPAVRTPRTDPAHSSGFRPDIQGLRAIAVMLVLLYHSGVSALSGGYVGVDVFFVISGFLITTHLLEALEREGRIRFGAFYAKRARRILPAALLVAMLTVLAAWIWMSPLLIQDVLRGAAATAPRSTSGMSSGDIQIHAASTVSRATSSAAGRMRRARLA